MPGSIVAPTSVAPIADGGDPSASSSALTQIRGVVERIVFHNEKSGGTILHVYRPDTRDTVAVLTTAPRIWAGEAFEALGTWHYNAKHGHQFNASKVTLDPVLSSITNPLLFLQSSFEGVGPKWAKLLHDAFGATVFERIENDDPALRAIKGLGKAKLAALRKSWTEVKARRYLSAMLASKGDFTVPQIIAAVESVCSDPSMEPQEVLQKDPYVFVRKRLGIDFHMVDRMAQLLGVARDDPRRIEAAILHSLHEEEGSGHCASPKQVIVKKAGALVTQDIPKALVDKVLQQGHVVLDDIRGTVCLYDKRIHAMEADVGAMLKRLTKGAPAWAKNPLMKTVDLDSFSLSKSQRHAVSTILHSKVSVLTGGPGVGKTKVVGTLVDILKPMGVRITLCAPTGRAAVRLGESAKLPAATIHRTLLVGNDDSKIRLEDVRKARYNKDNPLEADIVVVDESSMVDIELMHLLLQAIPSHCSLVLVGDADQLPSVGPGNVLADIMASQVCPTARLLEVHRQGAGSDIVRVASEVNSGNTAPRLATTLPTAGSGGDVVFLQAEPDQALHIITDLITKKIPALLPGIDILRDIQVLCPMRSRGKVSTWSLNNRLQVAIHQELLQRAASGSGARAPVTLHGAFAQDTAGHAPALIDRGHSFKSAQSQFWKGDKVMQVVNDSVKDVYNGEVGTVCYINAKPGSSEALQVSFGSNRTVSYAAHEVDDQLLLAYATTVHKAQGCEYPVVILPMFMEHASLLQRRLLYTGITRAKRLVVLVGQPAALLYTLANPNTDMDRWTKLKDILAS